MTRSIQDIERDFPVEGITCNGEQVWPFVRMYAGVKLSADLNAVTVNSSVIKILLKSFFYGFFNLFKRYDYLFFSSTDQRRINGTYYVDKSVDEAAQLLGKSLVIELPVIAHIPKSKLKNKAVVSKSFFFLLVQLYTYFLKDCKIENEALLQKILKEHDIQIDYKAIIKRNRAQYKVARLLYKWFRPKAVFIVCYYTHTGLIKAMKELGVKTIEIQHGLINKSHVAYNIARELDSNYFPDYLLTYGKNEVNVFEQGNYFIDSSRVIPIGHQYLDYLSHFGVQDERFKKLTDGYKKVVCITGQNHYIEAELLHFLIEAAQINPKNVYVYIPRYITNDYSSYSFPKNIVFANWLNCYEIMSQSHIHSTVYSTCAVESLSIGIPNVLIDLEGLATKHLKPVLKSTEVNYYVKSPEEYVQLIDNIELPPKQEVIEKNASVIIPKYNTNLEAALKQIFSTN